MKKINIKFPKTAKVYFNETSDGKLVAFSASQPTDETAIELEYEIILVTDDELSFRIGTDQAKCLLHQLKNSIAVCEYFNSTL